MYQILKQEASCAFKHTKGHAHDAHLFGVQDSYFTTARLYVFTFMTLAIYYYKSSFFQLTEVFPCISLSCKANARVYLAKTGHGPHSS